MKKIISAALIMALCLALFAGCGHTHTWAEANCTAAKTCSDCGETEGEALGHSWTEADCTTAKTCSVCGETEGEALGHSWTEADCVNAKTCSACGETEGEALGHELSEANYQQASVCSVCNETVGEPLVPGFVEHGIKADMELGKEYDYITVGSDGTTPIQGKTTITSYDIIESDDIRVARDGYEWHVVTFETLFDGAQVRANGVAVDYSCTDYYDMELFVDSADHSDPTVSSYSVNFNGQEQKIYFGQNGAFEENSDGSITLNFKISVQMPVDYDGIVVGLNSATVNSRDGSYFYDVYNEEDFLLFRLNS